MSKKKKKYAARTPLNVHGGIRAQLGQGAATRNWWNQRWIEALENFRIGARLGRGRSYAATGQVSELEIENGLVTALVQGASAAPYHCRVQFSTLTPQAEQKILRELRSNPMIIARLLVSDLPLEVEASFIMAGMPLFPRRHNDVQTRCSCPDYANPCKHLVALYYLIGEAIARNPLLLLHLRGLTRAKLCPPALPPKTTAASTATPADKPVTAYQSDTFYGRAQPAFDDYGSALNTVTSAPLLYRLGALPFWRSRERFIDTLEQLYARTATPGMTVWSGELLDLRREEEKTIVKGANLQLKCRRMRMEQ